MDLSQAVNVNDIISFLLGLAASATAVYKYLEKKQLIPQELQKELETIIGQAEEYQEKGYTNAEAQALGELIIKTVGEVKETAQAAAKK